MPRPRRLEGRACLIVGGTGGIGLASARRFRDEGARVVVSGVESGDELPEGMDALVADVASAEAVDNLVRQAVSRLGGRLDVLFHVAGVSGRRFGDGPLDACTDEGWRTVMDVNARGVFFTNRAAARVMLGQPIDESGLRGTILNLGSVLAESPAPRHFDTIAYAASKGAIRSLTLASAARYAGDRIRFNLIAPGLIDTPMAARAVGHPAIRSYLETKQPIVGGPGSVQDVAEAALFLAEPASRFLTGTVLNVDGGWSVAEGQHEP